MSLSLSAKDRLALISNLGTMLSAGIPIIDALDSMLPDSKGNAKRIMLQLRQDLNEGHTVSSSLVRFPRAFDPVTVNLIKAAEEAGTLDTTLKDLVKTIKKEMEFSSNIKSSLAYPVFVMVVFSGVLLLILGFVIPRIAKVFTSLHVPLPLPTKVLIWASDTLLTYYPFLIVGGIGLVLGILIMYNQRKRWLINLALSLPLLRRLGRQIDLARFTRSMHLLLASGLPITEVMELAKQVANKREIVSVIEQAKTAVSAGKPLSKGLQTNSMLIPPMMLRIIEAGETSGTLEASMQELSEYFDAEVANTLKAITTLMEPILLVVIGLLVGGMMLSIIAPIYNLIGQVRVR